MPGVTIRPVSWAGKGLQGPAATKSAYRAVAAACAATAAVSLLCVANGSTTVADTGKGMTKDQLEKAFGGFYTTKPGGTGLGLSIVRRLVLDAGGSLRVETKPGAGSKFIVELPCESG